MRIVEVRETTVSIASPIANAFIDFSTMTCSVVALVTDVLFERAISRGARAYIGAAITLSGLAVSLRRK